MGAAAARWTGYAVAVGFVLYHVLPVPGPLTFPYWGRSDVGLAQWLPVLAAVAVGLWCGLVSGRGNERPGSGLDEPRLPLGGENLRPA